MRIMIYCVIEVFQLDYCIVSSFNILSQTARAEASASGGAT